MSEPTEVPEPSPEQFSVGMLAEVGMVWARRMEAGERPVPAYLGALGEVIAKYRIDPNAELLSDPEQLLLERMAPTLEWWDQLFAGLAASSSAD